MRPSIRQLTLFIGFTALLGSILAQSAYSFSVVDDFESYDAGQVNTVTGGVWTAIGNAANSVIQEEGGQKILTYGAANTQGAYGALGVHSLGAEETGTYFVRVRPNATVIDNSFGLTDVEAPTAFGNYRIQAALRAPTGGSGIRLGARSGTTLTDYRTDIQVGTWYNIWFVVHNASNTWDLYMSEGFDDGEVVASGLSFRDSVAAGTFSRMLLIGNGGSLPVSIDDLYFTSGVNTTNPIEEPEEIVFTLHPANANAVVGGEVTFQSTAVGGPGERTYTWQVSTDGGNTWDTASGSASATTYTISPVEYADNGNQYRLHVSSGDQTATSDAATLTVSFPAPTVTQGISNVLLAAGGSHTFTVQASGIGELTYEWRKDDILLSETGNTLAVSNAQAGDMGTYSVRISDPAATAHGLPPTQVTLVGSITVYNPATAVFKNANDVLGDNPTSFNSPLHWSDGQAPRAGWDYINQSYVLRTPLDGNDYTFGGDSLIVNDEARLMYKSNTLTATITIDDLVLSGGQIEHQQGMNDAFNLAGNLHVIGDSRFWPKQGPINVHSTLSGTGRITVTGSDGVGRILVFASPDSTYTGSIVNNARFQLGADGVLNFVIGANGESNYVSGTGPQTIFDGTFVIDLTGASDTVGDTWSIIRANNRTFGETFTVAGFTQYGTVWVSDNYLFDQSTGVLEVFDPSIPRFLEHPADIDTFVGEDVTFESFVLSEGDVDYQWQFSGDGGETWTNITDATSATYTIESAPYGAIGLYRVQASAGAQTMPSNPASLTLTFPDPTIIQGISDITVREGDSHSFFVQAEGVGTLTYEWRKDDQVLGETGNVLDLGVIDASAAGIYSVTITDDAALAEGLDATSVTLTATLSTVVAPPVGRAIGLNFVGAASVGNPWGGSSILGILDPEDAAGILAVSNWNNSASVNHVNVQTAPLPLAENTGDFSGTSATWSSNNTWAAAPGAGEPNDTPKDKMFHGYIETRSTSALGQTSVTFAEIPYPEYDVYVYLAGGDPNVIGRVWLDDGSGAEFYFKNLGGGTFPRPYVQSSATTFEEANAADPTTFVRFSGVSASTLTIAHTEGNGGNSGGIAGIAILDTTPAGTAYPPFVTSSPTSKLVPAGGTVELAVTAQSQNEGTLSYQWQKDGTNIQTGPTLTLTNVTSAQTGVYSVTITDNSTLGTTSRTLEATLVVVDANRQALLSVDMQVGSHAPMFGHAMLRADGTVVAADPVNGRNDIGLGGTVEGDTIWNGLGAATGSSSYSNLVDSEGLLLAGLTFSVSGATGVEDDTVRGGIDIPITAYSGPLLRDYVYTTEQTPMTLTVGGLNAFAGREVTLVVYALGKDSTAWPWGDQPASDHNDLSTVTLAEANHFEGPSSGVTANTQAQGRDLRYNNDAFVTFVANVAGNGTVSWVISDVPGEPGLNAFNGFQMLITNEGDHVTTTPLENWRSVHFQTTENSGSAANIADFDGDGFSNLLEYALGTDPTIPGAALGVVVLGQEASGALTLTFNHIGDPSLVYQIEATNDLSEEWETVHTYPPFTEAGEGVTYTDTGANGGERRFLRLKVTIQE